MTWIPEEFVELNRQLYPDFAWPALGEEEVRFVNDEPMPGGWTNGESITLNVAQCTTDDLLLKENLRQLAVMIYSPRIRGAFLRALTEPDDTLLEAFVHLDEGRAITYLVAKHPQYLELMQFEPASMIEGMTHLYLKSQIPLEADLKDLVLHYMGPWWGNTTATSSADALERQMNNRTHIAIIKKIVELLPEAIPRGTNCPTYKTFYEDQNDDFLRAQARFFPAVT